MPDEDGTKEKRMELAQMVADALGGALMWR
jgi:hypothetical protein